MMARGRGESGRLVFSAKGEAVGFTALAVSQVSLVSSLIPSRGVVKQDS